MHFHFRLLPVEEIPPWGQEPETLSLSWFGLTLGWFWIEVEGQELFRYSQAAINYWKQQYPTVPPSPLPYEDYQVVRYWEDLLQMLPAILDPIPDDLAARVARGPEWEEWQSRAQRWQEQEEDESVWDTYYTAVAWWGNRTWDAGHLAYPPRISLWRVNDDIHIRWDNTGILVEGHLAWEAQKGEVTLPLSAFLAAVQAFHDAFLAEMEQRVQSIGVAWTRPEVQIDYDALMREQEERASWLAAALNPWVWDVRRPFSWDQVRAAIRTLEQKALPETLGTG